MVDFSRQQAAEEGVNPVETGMNGAQLYVLLEKMACGWKEVERLDVLLLRTICRLSQDRPGQAGKGFTSIEIVEKLIDLRKRSWSSPGDNIQMSKDVRTQWTNLLKFWEVKMEGIVQALNDEGIELVPRLGRTEGGGQGHPSFYRIEWVPLNDQERDVLNLSPPAAIQYDEAGVSYVCEDVETTRPIVGVFAKGYRLSGWRKFLLLTIILIPMLVVWLVLVIILFGVAFVTVVETKTVVGSLLSFSVAYLVAWKTIGPLLSLADDKIVMAPWWLQSEDNDRLLERRFPPRYPDKSIKAVRYTARCPLCDGVVSTKSGELEFWGRIVGRCENAPKEHLFSFDHVTRRGRYLR